MGNYAYDRWPSAITIYPDDATQNTVVTVTSGAITVANLNETYTISDYTNTSIADIVSELNGNLSEHQIVQTLAVGAESIVTSSLGSENLAQSLIPGNPFTIEYYGHVLRNRERSVIQLKHPRSNSRFESWYARIGKGKFRARFEGLNRQSYPGIRADTTYEFGTPEFLRQEWSTNYGPPYKDMIGEVPATARYHAVMSATVIKAARTPLFFKNGNVAVRIRGVIQPNSIIKDVDENNGLIYLNQKIGPDTPITIDYTFREEDYVYDAIDLNASIAHNPLIVDTYVAFYLKPTAAENALISGGDAVFHEVVTTEAAGRSKVANIIPSTIGTSTPLYEPVIYLGSLNVRQGTTYDEFEVIDTRSRGGGLFADKVDETTKTWREAEFYYDVGSFDGIEIPGNAAIVIKVPSERVDSPMERDEIRDRAVRDVAMGIVPIIELEE